VPEREEQGDSLEHGRGLSNNADTLWSRGLGVDGVFGGLVGGEVGGVVGVLVGVGVGGVVGGFVGDVVGGVVGGGVCGVFGGVVGGVVGGTVGVGEDGATVEFVAKIKGAKSKVALAIAVRMGPLESL
jgi:hypothetical protein